MATVTERLVENESKKTCGQRRVAGPGKKASGKGKPRTKQPKKVKFITTEIRCQEKTKGGLRYEVILAEPTTSAKCALSPQPSPTHPANIEDKLRAAAERRHSLEANKIAALNARLSKLEEVARKRDQLNVSFVNATRESLDIKMNNSEEKREAYITDLRNKLKEHLEGVEKTRLSLDQQTQEIRIAVDEKLKSATTQRDENIKKMVERLKEHEDQVVRVRHGITERVQQLENQIQIKLDQARERRETIEREQKEKLRNHEKRVEMVRQNKAKSQTKDEKEDIMDNMPVGNETASSG